MMLFGITAAGSGFLFWTDGIGGGTSSTFYETLEAVEATFNRFMTAYGSPIGIPINTRPGN